jgi:hypothetical protein
MYYENDKMDEKNVKGTIDLEGLTHAGLTSLKGEVQLIISNDTLMVSEFSITNSANYDNNYEGNKRVVKRG